MGSIVSSLIYQPLLLGVAITLMIIAIMYQERACSDGKDSYGSNIFKLNMGLSATIVIISVIISLLSAMMV
jgi:hypothetical protein